LRDLTIKFKNYRKNRLKLKERKQKKREYLNYSMKILSRSKFRSEKEINNKNNKITRNSSRLGTTN
jgi:hypothetical protein